MQKALKTSRLINLRDQEMLKEFAAAKSWEDKYKRIIQLGKKLDPLDNQYKTPKWQVRGCQSQVWLYASLEPQGTVCFQADSDALITKGLTALLLKYYSGLTPEEILSRARPAFLEVLDLQNHLTPTRAGGLLSIIKQIQYYAQAFSYLSKKKQ